MKQHRMRLFVAVLVFGSISCQALSGVRDVPQGNENSSPEVTEPSSSLDDSNASSPYPVTEDAREITDFGDGSILYYTNMSLEEVMDFYRDAYTSRGYTERELLTVVSDGVFSMVFDGDPSGKAVVIQSVDLGDGSRTVAIRLEAQ